MPFRHVAMYRWADHVVDEHVERLAAELDQLSARITHVRFVSHGPDAGVAEGSFDYTVVIDVDDLAAWRTTRDHPAYIVMHEELLTPHTVERAVSHFSIRDGADPEVAFDATELSDDELLERARRAAQAQMDALLAEPDDLS